MLSGRYGSEGEFDSFMQETTHDGVDGYDTIEWAAKLPGSSGKVGTFGVSYDALLQWRAAGMRPPISFAISRQRRGVPGRRTGRSGHHSPSNT